MTTQSLNSEEIQIIEALLFSSPEPLTQSKVDTCFDNDAPNLEKTVQLLNELYKKSGNAFFIENVAAGYRIVTRSEFDSWVRRLFTRAGKTKLSRASMEVMAIVAYRGPVTRSEIEGIRGVNSDSSVKTLLERNIIKIKGRSDSPGRALLYTVTDAFLISFGLEKLSDLPKLREISELSEGHKPTEQSHPELSDLIDSSDKELNSGDDATE